MHPQEQVPSDRNVRTLDPADPYPRPGDDLHVEAAHGVIVRMIADLDEGGILRFVHQLEHRPGDPWRVHPWRLVEHLALTAIRGVPPRPAPMPAAESPEPAAAAPAAAAPETSPGTQPPTAEERPMPHV